VLDSTTSALKWRAVGVGSVLPAMLQAYANVALREKQRSAGLT
jgi:hypothetical protein